MHIFRSGDYQWDLGGGAYQRDDGGTGAGERHDVEVVGQVELRMKEGETISEGGGERMK